MDNFHVIISQIIKDVEKGKNFIHQVRDRQGFNAGFDDDHDQDYYKLGLDDDSTVALTALDSALSKLRNSDHFSFDDKNLGNSFKSQECFLQDTHNKKDKRGCYKRRRGVEPIIMDTTNLTDDGFAWRKYGQKVILHAKHPRNYYRCTHKTDQGCQATKQVQQISENPKKHRIIYLGEHTCKLNPIKTLEYSSLNYLNFETNKSTHLPTPSLNFSFSNSNDTVKQEHSPVKMETQSDPSNLHNQYNSSPSSPDPTTTTLRSEISSVDQVYSSVASPHRMDVEEDYYSHLMADSNDFHFWQNFIGTDL